MRAPKHPVTGVEMRPCPFCGRLSGLTGIDGQACLACTMKGAPDIRGSRETAQSHLYTPIDFEPTEYMDSDTGVLAPARDPRRRPVDPNECQETCG